MNKLILLNHETGTFFEAYSSVEMKKIIGQEIDNGADLENLALYGASNMKIISREVVAIEYEIKKA
tara:strand:- start:33969 stop:34166 length:198 start_codon:yes stop_codon:yes gene_type:complete